MGCRFMLGGFCFPVREMRIRRWDEGVLVQGHRIARFMIASLLLVMGICEGFQKGSPIAREQHEGHQPSHFLRWGGGGHRPIRGGGGAIPGCSS